MSLSSRASPSPAECTFVPRDFSIPVILGQLVGLPNQSLDADGWWCLVVGVFIQSRPLGLERRYRHTIVV